MVLTLQQHRTLTINLIFKHHYQINCYFFTFPFQRPSFPWSREIGLPNISAILEFKVPSYLILCHLAFVLVFQFRHGSERFTNGGHPFGILMAFHSHRWISILEDIQTTNRRARFEWHGTGSCRMHPTTRRTRTRTHLLRNAFLILVSSCVGWTARHRHRRIGGRGMGGLREYHLKTIAPRENSGGVAVKREKRRHIPFLPCWGYSLSTLRTCGCSPSSLVDTMAMMMGWYLFLNESGRQTDVQELSRTQRHPPIARGSRETLHFPQIGRF